MVKPWYDLHTTFMQTCDGKNGNLWEAIKSKGMNRKENFIGGNHVTFKENSITLLRLKLSTFHLVNLLQYKKFEYG